MRLLYTKIQKTMIIATAMIVIVGAII
jgi:hypothetical protein